jgi:hypothetical protein
MMQGPDLTKVLFEVLVMKNNMVVFYNKQTQNIEIVDFNEEYPIV